MEVSAESRNYRLLTAVNESALSVRNGWVFFVGMMAFFFIAIAGVTHQDLLLNSPVKLPLIQIDIELTRFFQFAPLAVVLFHFGVLLQYIVLAGKTLALHEILTIEEQKDGSNLTHPLRLELSSYFFVQAMAGPARSPVLSVFLKAMTVITLGLFPLILLLYFQTTYLAFHDPVVTWAHRSYIIVDLFVLMIIGVFRRFPNQLFTKAFSSHIRYHSISILVTSLIGVVALFYAFCIATIPDSWLDQKMNGILGGKYSVALPYGTTKDEGRHAFLPTAWLFEGRVLDSSGKASSWFSRNLIVTDVDLVPYVNADREKANEVSLHLRGRDLRYANFSLSDMHRADMKEANLKQAKLSQTNLSHARLRGAKLLRVDLRDARLDHSDLRWAKLVGANLKRASMKGALFSSANLMKANLIGVDLEKANLQWANLLGVNLENANLRAATLSQASLKSANLNNTQLQGADLFKANMDGVLLRNSQMQRAILLWANLRAADLRGAQLQGSDLRSTNMSLTDLRGADLQGVDMVSAKMKDADLRNVKIWQTNPPSDDFASEVSKQAIKLKDPQKLQKAPDTYGLSRKKTAQEKRRQANSKRLSLLYKSQKSVEWDETDEYSIWESMKGERVAAEKNKYALQLSDKLATIGCRDRSRAASLLTSIIKRATDVYESDLQSDNTAYFPPFNGDLKHLYARLKAPNCLAVANVPKALMAKLKLAASKKR